MLDRVIDAAGCSGLPWDAVAGSNLRRPAMLKETRRRDCARRHWRPYRGRVLQRQRFRPCLAGRKSGRNRVV